MQILAKGRMIRLDEDDDIGKVLHNTMCKCGHALYLHGSYFHHYSNTFFNSQCTACGFKGEELEKFVCEGFEVEDAKE